MYVHLYCHLVINGAKIPDEEAEAIFYTEIHEVTYSADYGAAKCMDIMPFS